MSYDPNRPYGGASDPYGPPPSDPHGQPSGVPYNQPQSGQPYPSDPYNQPASGQPYNPTSPLPANDPYANPAGPYGNPSAPPYGQPSAPPYSNPSAPPYGQPSAPPYGQPSAPPYGQPTDQGYGYPPGGPPPGGGYPGGPPPPPPKKSKTGVIVGTIAVVLVLIIVFCSVAIWIVGRDDDKSTGSSGNPTASTSTSNSPTASPSPTESADSRTLIQPAGAPFSFRLPAGFQSVKVPSSSTSTGSSSQYSAAVATTSTEVNDFLIVDSYALSYDADAVDQTQLGTQFDSLVRKIQQDPSSRQNVTYNGNNGFWYKFDFGTSKAYSYFLFHGSNELQIRCQWTDLESTIKRGCEEMLSSIQITG